MTTNHDKNKNRIVGILKADPNVFDDGVTVGKLREIYVGQRMPIKTSGSNSIPFLYVTNGNPILTKKPRGVVQNNKLSYFDSIARYSLNIISIAKDKAVKSEQELDNIELAVSASLENNFRLQDPTSNVDPICLSSYIERVDSILFTDTKGTPKQGRTITLNLSII